MVRILPFKRSGPVEARRTGAHSRTSGVRSRGTANMAGTKAGRKSAAPAGRGGGRGKEQAKESGKGKLKRKRTWEDRASSDGSVDDDSSNDNVPLALRGKDARAAGSSSQLAQPAPAMAPPLS